MKKITNLNLRLTGAGFLFKKGNIGKKDYYHSQGKSYYYSCIKIPQIYHDCSLDFPAFFLSQKAITKQSVPNTPSIVNIKRSKTDLKGVKLGIISIAPYQPADRLTRSSESIKNHTRSIFPIAHNISRDYMNVN